MASEREREEEPSPESVYYSITAADASRAADAGVLYQWNKRIWEAQDHTRLEAEAFLWLTLHYPHKATPKVAQSCVAAAIMGAEKLPQPARHDLIVPLQNGYLQIDMATGDLQLIEPRQEDGITYVLEAYFIPTARAPLFMKFLADVLGKDEPTISWVQEYVGYTLMGDCRYQKALFLVGKGANGKSTFAEIIAALHRRVVSLQLNALTGFRLTPLLDASLVLVDETPQRIDEQSFKSLVSGGLCQVDRKFRDPISFRPRAKWLILGNAMPAISDQSHGFWRRMGVVPFMKQFTQAEQDSMLGTKIIEQELSGVLNWAIEGLIRLTRRGRFLEETRSMEAAQMEGQLESNSVMGWWNDDRAEVNGNFETPRSVIYRDYQSWCSDNGMSPLGAERFWNRLKALAGTEAVAPRARKLDGQTVRVVPLRLTRSQQNSVGKVVTAGWGR